VEVPPLLAWKEVIEEKQEEVMESKHFITFFI
jgi:hypothetical protein